MQGFGKAMKQGRGPARPGPQQGNPAALDGGPPQEGVPATPEQQAEYNKFYAYSILILYNEKFLPKVQEMFKKAPTPIEAAARVGTAIATRIYTAAQKQGSTIPPEVMLYAGQEVMSEIAELARVAGLADLNPEDVETAYYMAADMTRSALEGAGKLDKSMASEELESIRASVGDDRLESVVQRISGVQQQTMQQMQGGAAPQAREGQQ